MLINLQRAPEGLRCSVNRLSRLFFGMIGSTSGCPQFFRSSKPELARSARSSWRGAGSLTTD